MVQAAGRLKATSVNLAAVRIGGAQLVQLGIKISLVKWFADLLHRLASPVSRSMTKIFEGAFRCS